MAKFVSRIENAYLVVYACVLSALSLTNLLAVSLYPVFYPPEFHIYAMARASLFPWFRLLVILVPFSIFWGKRFLIATIYTLLALLPAYLEFIRAYIALQTDVEIYEKYGSLRILLLIANPLDYATFIMANALLVWLLSLVVRSYTADVTIES